jgi:rhamnosyl/mannosyltransferase
MKDSIALNAKIKNKLTNINSEPIKVLMVGKFYPPQYVGGIEYSLQETAAGLVRIGLNVDVVVSSRDGNSSIEEIDGVTVHRVQRVSNIGSVPISLHYPLKLRQMLKEKHYDVVHLHYPYVIGELSCLFNKINAKLVITYHMNSEYKKLLKKPLIPFMNGLLRKADKIIVSSDNLLKNAKHLSEFRGKCTVIPLSVKDEWFEAPSFEVVTALKSEYGSFIFFAGRLFKTKGAHVLIEAVRNLDCNLVLAGEGPELEPLKSLVGKLGVGDRVFFVGSQKKKRLKEFYNAAEVFCLPSISNQESFGLVLLEAMAAGKPVISTELGTGTTFINQHGETGLVVKPEDVDMLGEAIKRLMSDEVFRLKLGKNALKRANDLFREEVVLSRIVELYKS